jgi:hypothetical protein
VVTFLVAPYPALSLFSASLGFLRAFKQATQKERTMTGMLIFDLILSIAVVAVLAAVCRTAYVVGGRRHHKHPAVEAAPTELKRAA